MGVEFWGLVVATVTGFGGFGLLLLRLSYSLGRQTEIQDGLVTAVQKLADDLGGHVHEDANHFKEINDRLAEGSKKMAVFDERLQALQDDVREIKRVVTDDQYRPRRRRDSRGRFVSETD